MRQKVHAINLPTALIIHTEFRIFCLAVLLRGEMYFKLFARQISFLKNGHIRNQISWFYEEYYEENTFNGAWCTLDWRKNLYNLPELS